MVDIVPDKKGNRKIAIIGSGESKQYAPYGQKGWELWSLNNLFMTINAKYFHRWFELHVFQKKGRRYYRRGQTEYATKTINDYVKELASLNIPVYMQKKWDIIPKSQVFPFEKIMKRYGRYFGCSFAWMVAFALYEHTKLNKKVDTIGFWGVNLEGVEYYRQRPSTEYFIGLAKGMGIKIHIHEDCNLLKMPWVYAYNENFEMIDRLFVRGIKDYLVMAGMILQASIEAEYNG